MSVCTRFLLAVALICCGGAHAFEPSTGRISLDSLSITATGGPYRVSNPSNLVQPVCSGDGVTCDAFLLDLEIPEDYRAANPLQLVRFTLAWMPQGDDLDVYIADSATGEIVGQAASSGNPEIATVALEDLPSQVEIQNFPFLVTGAEATLTIELLTDTGGAGGVEVDLCEQDGAGNAGSAAVDSEILAQWQELAPGAAYGAFVHFNAGSQKAQDRLIDEMGLSPVSDFRRYARSVFVRGPVEGFHALVNHPYVSRIEFNRPLRYYGGTASWATRARVAQESVSGGPYFDSLGRRLTGEGMTVGVIDGGLNAAHEDFAGRVLHNYRIADFLTETGPQFIDTGYGSSEAPGGGHGTHVTGIIAGSGLLSQGGYPDSEAVPLVEGTFTGVVPQAQIVNWGLGAGIVVLSSNTAYMHLLDNLDTYDPPIRVVNNSYGDDPGTPYNEGSTTDCLLKEITERGVIMAFAAGNDGGNGSADMTSSTCKNPRPGVICVASYDDTGTGARDAALSTFSSRGVDGEPDTYPDISAPGSLYTSTCLTGLPDQVLCVGGDEQAAETDWQPYYGTISGTSMASPHVTGAIALILQARPELTPLEVEQLLQNTARKVGVGYEADPQNPGGTHKFDYGAGLLDVQAALDALGVSRAGLPPAGQETLIVSQDVDSGAASPAGDVIALSMQEISIDELPGIMHRITVADASDQGRALMLALTIERNVGGEAFSTQVLLDGSGVRVADPGPANNAVAASASLDGNTIHVFVPYLAMGYPAGNEPIHNIRVISVGDLAEVDYAPSPDVGAELSAGQPMYGRPFTVQLPAAPLPSDERSCVLPGLTKVVSPAGVTGLANSGLGHEDLRQVWMAEPADLPGKIVFTMKVDNLAPAPIPGHRWYVYFELPDDTQRYWVAMDTTGVVPAFRYGTYTAVDTPAAGVGTFTVVGDLDPQSSYDADGTITLVFDKSVLGFDVGEDVTGIAASIRETSNPVQGSGLTVDSAGSSTPYRVVGNENCVGADGGSGPSESDSPSRASANGERGGALPLALLGLLLISVLVRRRR